MQLDLQYHMINRMCVNALPRFATPESLHNQLALVGDGCCPSYIPTAVNIK